jgi:uncharacterized membrane protein YfcA
LRAAGLSTFGLPPRSFLATSTAVALLVDLARTPVYLARTGSQLIEFLPEIALAAAGCLIGTVLGERVFLGMSRERYRLAIVFAVLCLGIWLCVQGL